jgi:hypothetical protein
MGFADSPVVPAAPRPREPMDGELGGRGVQDSSMVLASWQVGASPGLPGRSASTPAAYIPDRRSPADAQRLELGDLPGGG